MAITIEEQSQQPAFRLNELQQRRVWDGWFTSEVRAQYFAVLAHRYHRLHMFVTWGTLMASSGTFASILASLTPPFLWLARAFALAATALSLFSAVGRFETKSAEARDLYQSWSELADRYRDLWENMYGERAANVLAELDTKAIDLGKRGALFPNKQRLVRKSYKRVAETLAAATGIA